MYPSSTSSSSQGSMGPSQGTSTTRAHPLMRYGSAPSSLLSTAVESVIGQDREFSSTLGSHHHQPYNNLMALAARFFPVETSSFTSESNCKASNNTSSSRLSPREQHQQVPNINTSIGLQRTHGLKTDTAIGGGGAGTVSSATTTAPLVRHSSSPAGFLNHLAHAASSNDDNRFSITRGHAMSRLNSQLSFTRQEPLSQISEENENMINGLSRENEPKKSSHSYATTSYGMGSWEDGNSLIFSVGPSKRAKDNINSDIVNGLNSMETQFQFGMPIEMTTMDKMLNIPQDSVPCKIRAKRGCATHPRSIAERERRTRISGKLKKLQELVPNMDKQTSYADMLDLAVQHIKGLQNQVQKLNKELENCTCGCRKPRNAGGDEKS